MPELRPFVPPRAETVTTLRLDFCSAKAARYACEHWHYSATMPAGKTVKFGVWEGGSFTGAVIFGTGAGPQVHRAFGVERTDMAELVRVALRDHAAPVSRIVAIAVRLLRRQSPGLLLLVSYADPLQNHHGGIYQAMNWTYLGVTKPCTHFRDTRTGEIIHSKTLCTGRPGYATRLRREGKIEPVKFQKHKYAYALDRDLQPTLDAMAEPYPKPEPVA